MTANNFTTTIPTQPDRRHLLGLGAFMAAAAVAPALAADRPDAELIRLDGEYRSVLAELGRRGPVFNERCVAAQHQAGERINAERLRGRRLTDAELSQMYIDAETAAGVYDPAIDVEAVHWQMDKIQDRAKALRATTLEGLTVKVRIAAHWRDPDVDSAEIDSLLADLKTLCGVV